LDAFAAVITPSFSNAGLKVGIFSNLTFPGSSSSDTVTSFLLSTMLTGTISSSKT